ncbi:MAG: hypothetical protein ACQERU_09995 [Bacteroidota bacterium]
MRARMGKTARLILKNETASRKLLSNIIEAGKNKSTIKASVSDDENEYTFREMSVR